jgi:dinuclear metal center YbgI/SA1388 family protein
MQIANVISYLEELAPRSSQEAYDNCGLLVGDRTATISSILVTLDSTEEVVEEAINRGCNLIIAHHPIVFKGLKSLTGENYVERTILSAIKNNIAIYAIHTNLDNYWKGVNFEIGRRMGLKKLKVLSPKAGVLYQLSVYVPHEHHNALNNAVFAAGAGRIGNYEECHFAQEGVGTFKPMDGANPFSGEIGELSAGKEIKAEYLVSAHRLKKVLAAMHEAHPYEEVAHNIVQLANENQTEGSGMIGELENEMDEIEFLSMLKQVFKCGAVRHTALLGQKVRTVAFCGGSGSFLLGRAKAAKADVFVTGDFKYHEFFDAENQILIADIGHYESEQFTSNLIADILKKKFTTFAVHLTGINTNPINYF